LLYYWLGVYIPDYPPEPKSYGDFPTKPVWVMEASEKITATPVVIGSKVFVRTEKFVYLLDSANGNVLYRRLSLSGDPLMLTPQIWGDVLVVPEKYSNLAVISIDTGKLHWRTISSDLNDPDEKSIDSFLVQGNSVLVARANWKLTSYDMATGSVKWSQWVPSRAILQLATSSQRVYLSVDNIIRAYDIEQGDLLWEKDLGMRVGPILSEDKTLYVAGSGGPILALDEDTLEERWILSDLEVTSEIRYLTLDKDVIYMSADRLYAFSKDTGRLLWTSEKTGPLEVPVIIGDRIYVRNTETTLYSLDAETGRETGRLLVQVNTPMKHEPPRGPAVSGNFLLIPFGDNRLFCYRP
jgi:outer membrane protein assembly factor BamB